MGEILREDINIQGILLGLEDEEICQIVPQTFISISFVLRQLLTPWFIGKRIDVNLFHMIKTMFFYMSQAIGSEKRPKFCKETQALSLLGQAYAEFFHSKEMLKAQV